MFELGKRGTYANVTDKGDFTVPDGKPRFICASFNYLRGDRVDIDVGSFLCLSSWNNKFVKISDDRPEGRDDAGGCKRTPSCRLGSRLSAQGRAVCCAMLAAVGLQQRLRKPYITMSVTY